MTMPAAAAVLLAFVSCSAGTGRKDGGTKTEPVQVRVAEVSEKAGPVGNSYVGTAVAAKSAFVSSPYPGKLASMNVSKGEKVRKGQVIAEIESYAVKSSWESARATLKQAEDGYDRAMKVHGSGSLPDVKLVEVETRLAKARSAAAAAEQALEDCRVKAPYDAVVSDIFTDPGMELNALFRIARVVDISTMEIHFPVPENEIGRLETGMSATVEIPALDAVNLQGRLTYKGVEASPLSHTYSCSLVLDRQLPELRPGMVCEVRIDGDGAGGFVIPAASIRTDRDGRYVWTVTDEGIVRKTYIAAGGFSGRGVIVSEGLSEGDLVITEGMQKVCTGMKVRVAR